MAAVKEKDDNLTEITPAGRACFVHVWEPHAWKDDKDDSGKAKEPQYGVILVFTKGTDFSALKTICLNAVKKKWGEDKTKWPKGLKMPFRDASDYEKYGEPFDEDGAKMIILKSRTAPGIVNQRAKAIIEQADFYPGCWARASVYAHAYDTRGNKGVTFLLNNLQKTKDDAKLAGARMNPEDEFDALEGGGNGGDELDDLF